MKIKIVYFASLRESLGKSEEEVEVQEESTVQQIWQIVNPQANADQKVLCAVNKDYADWNTKVNSGDEIAFFPPVTGG